MVERDAPQGQTRPTNDSGCNCSKSTPGRPRRPASRSATEQPGPVIDRSTHYFPLFDALVEYLGGHLSAVRKVSSRNPEFDATTGDGAHH